MFDSTTSSTLTHLPATEPVRSIGMPPALDDRQGATLRLFCKALDEVNRLERRPVCSAIEFIMGRIQPGFDVRSAGFANIETLAAWAANQGLVQAIPVNGEVLVQRRFSQQLPPETEAEANPTPASYRTYIESKLKCPIPSAPIRKRVFEATVAILSDREDTDTPMSLLDLSCHVKTRLGDLIAQRSVFKLLFSIVLVNAFAISSKRRLHNIGILAPLAPVESWDDLFAESCMAGLRRDRPNCSIQADALAHALDVPVETVKRLLTIRRRSKIRTPQLVPLVSEVC